MASQKIIPFSGIQRDRSELYISEAQAYFIKNLTYSISDNNSSVLGNGQNEGVFTPLESNTRFCSLSLPTGVNKCIGYYESTGTNEGYVFVWNSLGNHLIYRLNGNTGTCQKVYQGSCLNFQLQPQHFIAEGRCELRTLAYFNRLTDREETRKYLIFTDNFNDQRFISVEDSIATDSFNSTTYPFFARGGASCNKCEWINLGIPMPMECMGVEAVEDEEGEDDLPDLMKEKGWQWRIRRTDHWGRQSEWGVISERYFSSTGGSCAGSGSRCVNLTFDAGCPFDEKFEIAFRNCADRTSGPATDSDWSLYDTIEKYNNCDNVEWYLRELNHDLEYDDETNTFTYLFCGNKQCTPIAVTETNRLFNLLPIRSGSVFNTGNGISLARNVHGREPLDCSQLEKIDFTVTAPVDSGCDTENILRKIDIWAVIDNAYDEGVQHIRVENGIPIFGASDCSKNNPFTFKQTFPKLQEGFVGYLAGTKHYAISNQYMYDTVTGIATYVGTSYNPPGGILGIGRYIPLQKWELRVPPSKYIFRVASHRSSPTDDYQKTSTYLIGQTPLTNIGALVGPQQFEFLINVCNVDVEIKDNPLLIYDLTRKGKGCAVADVSGVVEGYLREDEINKYPIELARVEPNKFRVYSELTDHNGHYFATDTGRGFYVNLYGTKNCDNNAFLAKSSTSYENAAEWYRFDDLYAYRGLNAYRVGDRFLVRGHIGLCDEPGTGVAGALVILSRGQFSYTDSNGDFTIVAHTVGQTGVRTDNLIYSQRGGCLLTNCEDECSYCFDNVAVVAPGCTGSERVVTVAELLVNIYGAGLSGPQMGGRYGLGVVLYDWMGRASFVQALDRFYVDIPSLQQTQVYGYSTIGFTIANNIVLPSWVKWMAFYITENLNYDDFITWVAERVQFVDNTGKSNSAAPTQIRLYYESLAEYDKQYQYSTNTQWSVLSEDSAIVVGDRVEIVANADGVIFNRVITGLVKYDKAGKYFAIDYDDDLKGLKDGALIKLIRPKQCEVKEYYYEFCPIRVVNQVPTILSGIFNYADSYLQSRQIPVPLTFEKTDPDTGEIITTTDNQLRNYPFLFEHHSPSDLWGDHCGTRGRVNVKNPYENQQLFRMEVASSAAISNNGVVNGLHYYTDANTFSFDEQKFVGIVSVVSNDRFLFICETGSFVAVFNDQSVRVTSTGAVVAQTAENKFGKPQDKNDYGCNLLDINTIRKYKNLVLWVDRSNGALVMSNYADADDVSVAGLKSWITSKVKYNLSYNTTGSNDKKYFHGCIDPYTKEYLLTSFSLQAAVNADAAFVNQERDFLLTANETVGYHIFNKRFIAHAFTPEYFGSLQGDSKSAQLFAFRKGEAWYHHSQRSGANDFLNFFGTQTEWVFEPVANLDNTKVKNYGWVEVYVDKVRVYADRVVTEKGQVSRIMPKFFDRFDRFWSAAFLCDLLTPVDNNLVTQTGINKLTDGDPLSGRWLRVRIVPHPADRAKYMELTAVVLNFSGVEKSST